MCLTGPSLQHRRSLTLSSSSVCGWSSTTLPQHLHQEGRVGLWEGFNVHQSGSRGWKTGRWANQSQGRCKPRRRVNTFHNPVCTYADADSCSLSLFQRSGPAPSALLEKVLISRFVCLLSICGFPAPSSPCLSAALSRLQLSHPSRVTSLPGWLSCKHKHAHARARAPAHTHGPSHKGAANYDHITQRKHNFHSCCTQSSPTQTPYLLQLFRKSPPEEDETHGRSFLRPGGYEQHRIFTALRGHGGGLRDGGRDGTTTHSFLSPWNICACPVTQMGKRVLGELIRQM